MAGEFIGGARAIGQGLGMGWGDEVEGWLRAKAGQGTYEDNVKRIRDEYAQYSKENPTTVGAIEIASGIAPGVIAMMVPGGQPLGTATIARTASGPLTKLLQSQAARNIALGASTSAITGQGLSEQPGFNANNTLLGDTVLGGTVGAVLPVGVKAIGTGLGWARNNLIGSEALTARRAAANINKTLTAADLTPHEMGTAFQVDQGRGVPSIIANLDAKLAQQAGKALEHSDSSVGAGIADLLQKQQAGTRDRVMNQITHGLQSRNYYDDLAQLEKDMAAHAAPHYANAYAYGEVTDPKVLAFLDRDVFKKGMQHANESLNTRGIKADLNVPTVENLDHIKRGLDDLIEKETDPITGKLTSKGRDLIGAKTEFLSALDTAVPDYALARGIYAGGAALRDAMRTGLHDWSRMPGEKVTELVAKMNDGEKAALRTGVARHLYDKVYGPTVASNSAQRVIGSPEIQERLRPLFKNPGEFNLFKSAMEREAQLYQQSKGLLSKAANPLADELGDSKAIPTALHRGLLWGWGNGLASLASSAISSGKFSNEVAGKMSKMLSAGTPDEVMTVVKALEDQAAHASKVDTAVRRGTYGLIQGTAHGVPIPGKLRPTDTATEPGAEMDALANPGSTDSIAAEMDALAKQPTNSQ